jgi:hypothetical protein
MGKVEECVERKLSEHGTPGEKPSEQDLAIKFQECRDDHPGGDSGFGENMTMGYDDNEDADFKFAGSTDTEEDRIQTEIAQRMHEQQFNQPLVSEAMTIEMINGSKIMSNENKSSVLGMAYNYHNKIFGDDEADDIEKGNTFSNDVAQEMYKTVLEIARDWPHKTLTNEYLSLELARRGHDPIMAREFVYNALEVDLYPNVAAIPQTEDKDLEVPNQNARTDFKPEDIMMGGVPREDLGADTITQDKKPNLGPKWKEDPNKETNQEETEISKKNKKRAGNQDGYNKFSSERVHHVANSTMSKSPEASYPVDQMDPTMSQDSMQDMTQTMDVCDPGSQLNPTTGTCDKVSLGQLEQPDLGVGNGIPMAHEYSKKN